MILVTGSAGHLGEGLMRTLRGRGMAARGLDRLPSPWTDIVGSIDDPAVVRAAMSGVEAVLHTATLHKPHVATHERAAFVAINVAGTLHLLEAAVEVGVRAFVLTSTTSVFGAALAPAPGEPAAWITEDVRPVPRNIYGVTKSAAEDLCELFARRAGLPLLVLRTSRFFPEADDSAEARAGRDDRNHKVDELLHRRVDLADVVGAHLLALERAPSVGFGRYVVSATTPFHPEDAAALRQDAAAVIARRVPSAPAVYERLGWTLPASLDRVYVNALARRDLGWEPRFDFIRAIDDLEAGRPVGSELARVVGSKGYHERRFADGPYPVGRW